MLLVLVGMPLLRNPAGATMPGPVGRLLFVGSCTTCSGPLVGLQTINADGHEHHKPFPTAANYHEVDGEWSPDGTTLLVNEYDLQSSPRTYRVSTIAPNGTKTTRLQGAQQLASPTWSPNGTSILFISSGDLFVQDSPDSIVIKIADTNTATSAAYSPDGSKIAYAADGNVHVMTANGGNDTVIASGTDPDWAPDSSRIVYTRTDDDTPGIYTNLPVGGDEQFLHAGTSPVWSPDGARIAFVTRGTGPAPHLIRLIDPDGSDLTTIFDESGDEPILLNWQAADVCASGFPDVGSGHAFCADIDWLASASITGGFNDGTYRPASPITRSSMAAFLYRYAGSPEFTPPAVPTFADVPTSHTFYDEVEWAVAEGLAGGFDDGTFRPGASITRGSMAAFLFRLDDPAFTDPATPTFDDVANSHPFFTEIEWLAETEVTTGFPDGTYRPGAPVTRGSFAAFLHRFDALPV